MDNDESEPHFLELHYYNKFIPKNPENSDKLSTIIKNFMVFCVAISIFVGGTHPLGILYSTFLRPVYINLALLHRVPLDSRFFLTPESGMHYITIIIYFLACVLMIKGFEKLEINMPLHKIIYSFSLMMVTMFAPFEFVYLILYDIYHSIPVYDYPIFIKYGWWLDFPKNIYKTILFVDGFFVIAGLYCMWFVSNEIRKYYSIKFITINKTTVSLLCGYIILMALWVSMPLYSRVDFVWGSPYFPQTIYPEYGNYSDYNITIEGLDETYGIVNEIWVPNDLVKILNHSSKAFSVAFMFYVFYPRKKKFSKKKRDKYIE